MLEEKIKQLEMKVHSNDRMHSQIALQGDKTISNVGETTSIKYGEGLSE